MPHRQKQHEDAENRKNMLKQGRRQVNPKPTKKQNEKNVSLNNISQRFNKSFETQIIRNYPATISTTPQT